MKISLSFYLTPILVIGLLYKLLLPVYPFGSISPLIQPIFYLFIVVAVLVTFSFANRFRLVKKERKFVYLLILFYFILFLSTLINIQIANSNFDLAGLAQLLLILFVSLSGFLFGSKLRKSPSSINLVSAIFLVFIFVLFCQFLLVWVDNFVDKRPFTLQNGVISLIFIWFLSHYRFKFPMFIIIFLMLFMFFASGSRTVLFGMLLLLIICFINEIKASQKILIIFFVIAITAWAAHMFFQNIEYFGRLGNVLAFSQDSRFQIWESLFINMQKEDFNWLIGKGFVSHLYEFSNHAGVTLVNTPHNTYIYLLYYTGVLGLLLGCYFIFYILKNLQKTFQVFMLLGLLAMLFNDSLLFPHSYSYIVDYWFFFFFVSIFWINEKTET